MVEKRRRRVATPQRDEALGRRLREAIDAWGGGGIKAFQEALAARGVHGSSYAMVHKYLNGAEPPLAFVREAAALTGVRFEWLAEGRGQQTETAHRRASIIIAHLEEIADWMGSWADALGQALEDGFPALGANRLRADTMWEATIPLDELHAVARIVLLRAGEYPPDKQPDDLEAEAEIVGRVAARSRRLGEVLAELYGMLSIPLDRREELSTFVQGVATAMMAADAVAWARDGAARRWYHERAHGEASDV